MQDSPIQDAMTRREALGLLAGGVAGVGALSAGKSLFADEKQESISSAQNARGRIHQSVCHWCYGRTRIASVEDLARESAKIGYKSVELIGPEHWATVKKHGLIVAMPPGTGPIHDCLNRKENHERCLAELRKNITLAAEAGFPNVICFSGNRQGMPDEVGLENCALALKQVAGLAEEKKVTICMELLNSKVDHKDYMCDHTAWGVELVKKVGSPRFKLLYDIYHMQIMEGDVIRTIQQCHEYIAHYHTGGNPGRNEIDETQELNYTAVMKAIADTGFTGYIAQEFIPKRDPVASLEQAFRICTV